MSTCRAAGPRSEPQTPARAGGLSPLVLIACGLMAMIDGADAQSLSIAAPLISKALSMQSAAVGLMFSIAALGGAVGYLCGGFLSDRWGARAVAVAGAVVIGLFQLATPQAGNVVALIAIRFVVSLALGAVVPALVMILAGAAPASLRHRIQGLFWACFPVGILSSGILNSWILSNSRWQVIFLIGGIAPLVMALVSWTVIPASRNPAIAAAGAPDLEAAAVPLRGGWLARALLTGLIFFFTNGAIAIVMNWTPTLLVRSGYPAATGATAMASQAAGALLTMSVTGFIVERSKIWPVFISLVIAACAAGLYASLIHSLPFVLLSMLLLGGFLALAGTASVFLAGEILPGNNPATGIGLCLATGRVGQMIFPGLLGLSLQAGGSPGAALMLTATLPACGALCALALALMSFNAARTVGRNPETTARDSPAHSFGID